MTRPRSRVRLLVLLAVAASCLVGPAAARAQEDPQEVRAIDADVERLRNNPFPLGRDPERVRRLVLSLLLRGSPRADAALREMLLDVRTHATVVEQIAVLDIATAPHRLLDDVVERVRKDAGSPLLERLAPALLRSDGDVIRRLSELARDAGRPPAYRTAAVQMLGATGHANALPALAELWGGPERDLRDPAREAFEKVAPGAAADADEARRFSDGLLHDDLPLSEALRRLLRERIRAESAPAAAAGDADDYRTLALEMLPKATLDQVLRLYVHDSPSPEVRAAAVRRLAEFPYDAAGDADGRTRAARALFAALRREESAAVESAILETLVVLAPAVRGNVGTDDMEALLSRVRPGGASRSTRLLAARLAGELRDDRAVPALEASYLAFPEGDVEARLAVLAALQDLPVDRTTWVVARVESERRPQILKKLVVLLGRSRDAAATSAFSALLADRARVAEEVRREAASALATQWASSQSAAARDALLDPGLGDPDAGVRTVCAKALGLAGPGRERTLPALLAVVRTDLDADVRNSAARSVILLDEAAATANLGDRFADDAGVFDVYRAHFLDAVRRDQTPDRLLAACDALAAAGQRPFAVAMLQSAVLMPSADVAGGVRMRSALAAFLLDEGRPGDAESLARTLVAEAKDDVSRDRSDLLLCRALTASNQAERLGEAERRLLALRAADRLDRSGSLELAATLGDCRLRRGDAIGALEALDVPGAAADAPANLRLRLESLRRDADTKLAAERTELLKLVDALAGAGGPEAAAALRARRGRWAVLLAGELSAAADFASVRRLMAAVEAVTGSPAPRLADDATKADVAAAVAAARKSLAAVRAAATPSER